MASFLILFSTVDGQTRRICEKMAEVIDAAGHNATVRSLGEPESVDPAAFDAAIIGASVRYGKHRPAVAHFINHHAATLDRMPAGLFSVNLVARDPAKCTPEGNPYLQKLLRQIAWQPRMLAVFAGKLDYSIYRTWDRLIIKLIMKITHGPTDVDTIEYTDWVQVEAFALAMVRAAEADSP